MSRAITYLHEPTDLQCGQAVLAMLAGCSVAEIIELLGNDRETTLKEMRRGLDHYGIHYGTQRREARTRSDLPDCALLSLETPRCWHWSLYCGGTFYDPEHGVLSDFPESARRYYWEITD